MYIFIKYKGRCVPQEFSFTGALKWKNAGSRGRSRREGNEQLGHDVDGGEGEQLEHQPWQPAIASMKTSYSLLFARVDLGFDESSLVGE